VEYSTTHGHIGRELKDRVRRIEQAPLPERWVDLINRLDAEEEARKASVKRKRADPPTEDQP